MSESLRQETFSRAEVERLIAEVRAQEEREAEIARLNAIRDAAEAENAKLKQVLEEKANVAIAKSVQQQNEAGVVMNNLIPQLKNAARELKEARDAQLDAQGILAFAKESGISLSVEVPQTRDFSQELAIVRMLIVENNKDTAANPADEGKAEGEPVK